MLLWLVCAMRVVLGEVQRDLTERDTRLGRIRGYKETVLGKEVHSYLGIPFGKPPVGTHRFQKPESYGGWSDTWDGTNLPNSCPQVLDYSLDSFLGVTMWNANTNITEDCLFLNVWSPRSKDKELLPVMVWIYGGGFYAGSSTLDLYDGRNFAAEGNVVLVSMQYRTGAIGFLYLGTSGAPGNAGLLDQQLALEWIFNNIQDYGGDNSRITIFGESAGAASVGLHMLSPLSKETFHSAILQSASAINPWVIDSTEVAKDKSLELASKVGCHSENIEDVLHCMREVPHEKLSTVMWELKDESVLATPLAPVVDNYFLRQHPMDIVSDKTFKMVPTIIGVNHDEGAYFLPFEMPNLYNFSKKDTINTQEKYLQGVRELIHGDDELVSKIVAYEYKYPYHYKKKLSYGDLLDDILGDYCFICPTINFALSLAEAGQSVYFYQFTHVSSKSPWPKWMGALHGYEIDTEFGLPLNDSNGYTMAEKELSKRIIRLWSNFARTHDPTKGDSDTSKDKVWPTYSSESRQYIVLNTTHPAHIADGLRDRKCSFWRELVPYLISREKQHTNPDYQVTCGSISLHNVHSLVTSLITILISSSIMLHKCL